MLLPGLLPVASQHTLNVLQMFAQVPGTPPVLVTIARWLPAFLLHV